MFEEDWENMMDSENMEKELRKKFGKLTAIIYYVTSIIGLPFIILTFLLVAIIKINKFRIINMVCRDLLMFTGFLYVSIHTLSFRYGKKFVDLVVKDVY